MAGVAERKWPVEPLERLIEVRVSPEQVAHEDTTRAKTAETMFLEGLGMDRTCLSRWRRRGGIPEGSADRLAVALGEVPCAVWGDAWWEGIGWPEDEEG